MKRRPRLFLDLDGVLADFDGGFPLVFGFDHRTVPKARMWDAIHHRPGFFRDLHPFLGARAFFHMVRPLRPAILTSASASMFHIAAREKHAWVRRHLCANVLVIPVRDGLDKAAFVQDRGDVLVDDYRKNCEAWRAAGGLPIKHEPGNFVRTLGLLATIYGPLAMWKRLPPEASP